MQCPRERFRNPEAHGPMTSASKLNDHITVLGYELALGQIDVTLVEDGLSTPTRERENVLL